MSAPVLWHIPVSHYNEKARWALDHKGIAHARRAPPPPSHMVAALWLTKGATKTFPLLALDGRRIADSTAIIAALEHRHPDPPLYPDDPDRRASAMTRPRSTPARRSSRRWSGSRPSSRAAGVSTSSATASRSPT